MDYLRNLTRRYRVPDFSRLFFEATDNVDGKDKDTRTFFERMEPLLVQFQEIALWTEPGKSTLALVLFHCMFWLVPRWCSSILFTAAFIGMIGFIYTTWVSRIWPEIRIEEPTSEAADHEEFTPVHPECFSGPEIRRQLYSFWSNLESRYRRLKEMRQESPAKFCTIACSFFFTLAYFGAYISAKSLLYYSFLISLTGPGIIRLLLRHPVVKSYFKAVFKKQNQEDQVDGKDEPANETAKDGGIVDDVRMSVMETIKQGSDYVSENFPRLMAVNLNDSSFGKDEQNVVEEHQIYPRKSSEYEANISDDGKPLTEVPSKEFQVGFKEESDDLNQDVFIPEQSEKNLPQKDQEDENSQPLVDDSEVKEELPIPVPDESDSSPVTLEQRGGSKPSYPASHPSSSESESRVHQEQNQSVISALLEATADEEVEANRDSSTSPPSSQGDEDFEMIGDAELKAVHESDKVH